VPHGLSDYKGSEPVEALNRMARMLNNLTAVVKRLNFNARRALDEVNADYSTTTELADVLQRDADVPFSRRPSLRVGTGQLRAREQSQADRYSLRSGETNLHRRGEIFQNDQRAVAAQRSSVSQIADCREHGSIGSCDWRAAAGGSRAHARGPENKFEK